MHTIQLLIELKFGSITSPIFKISFPQIPNCLTELYFHIAQKSRFSDSPINYRCPPIAVNSTMIQVADFLCLCCWGFVPLLKSRFFVIYFRGVTLAGGIKCLPLTREVAKRSFDGGREMNILSPCHGSRRASPLGRGGLLVAILYFSCYNTPNESEDAL